MFPEWALEFEQNKAVTKDKAMIVVFYTQANFKDWPKVKTKSNRAVSYPQP